MEDELFGGIDFHQRKAIDSPASRIIMEKLLQKGTANQVIAAYLGNGKVFAQTIFHVGYNLI